ncbi:MAG: hypothetical protein K8T25_01150 [Planctomycetia bacterium]|nr:hypothetical protein [Planctomycetia bacterium]
MLSIEQVQSVQRLLAAGECSQREIARRTGVSRPSIAAIANGTRVIQPPRPIDEPAYPAQRCADCGGLVVMPCLACLLRRHRQRLMAEQRARRKEAASGIQPTPSRRPAA